MSNQLKNQGSTIQIAIIYHLSALIGHRYVRYAYKFIPFMPLQEPVPTQEKHEFDQEFDLRVNVQDLLDERFVGII